MPWYRSRWVTECVMKLYLHKNLTHEGDYRFARIISSHLVFHCAIMKIFRGLIGFVHNDHIVIGGFL